MPTWPRTIVPRETTDFDFPAAQRARGQSGKWTLRSTSQVGRVWTETYLIDNSVVASRTLVALIRDYLRRGQIFDITHYLYLTPLGSAGGSPLVDGANQTGTTITLKAATTGQTPWIRGGDIVKFAGLNLVYDVTADANSDGGGAVSLPISPAVFSGGSPADEAAVTVTGVTVRAIVVSADMPTMRPAELGIARVTFAEAP
jgi:hypothetical protein